MMGDGCLAEWCVAQDRGERKIGCREWGCGTVRRPPQPRQAFSFRLPTSSNSQLSYQQAFQFMATIFNR